MVCVCEISYSSAKESGMFWSQIPVIFAHFKLWVAAAKHKFKWVQNINPAHKLLTSTLSRSLYSINISLCYDIAVDTAPTIRQSIAICELSISDDETVLCADILDEVKPSYEDYVVNQDHSKNGWLSLAYMCTKVD